MGATPDPSGTNFAVYSSSAAVGAVSLCLFANDGTETRLPMSARTGDVWHAYVPGVEAGQRYGFRVDGPWRAQAGIGALATRLAGSRDPGTTAPRGPPPIPASWRCVRSSGETCLPPC